MLINMFPKKDKKMQEDVGCCGGDSFNLDSILSELGSFGKYQLLLLLLLAFRDSFLAMCNFNFVFTATEVAYRCQVPECESLDSAFHPSWSQFALEHNTQSCFRMKPHLPSSYNMTEDLKSHNMSSMHNMTAGQYNDLLSTHNLTGGQHLNEDFTCKPEAFREDSTVPCEKIIYEDYNSIVAEFDLGCQPWKRTLIGTVHNLGLVISFILSGIISDRYGRKVIIVGTPLVVGLSGIIKSFSVNYWMLLIFEFIETAFGYGNASMVLSLEAVNHKRRVVFSCISDMLSSFGTAFFGLIAWKIPYWRYMLRAIYAPLLIVVFYIFLVDEGVRWLIAHNKEDEAVRVLNKVADYNNVKLSNKAKDMLKKITDERRKANEANQEPHKEMTPLLSILRSKTILLRVIVISLCCVCCQFVFNGTLINSANIFGNKYVNFSVLMLASIPTRIITALTLTKFGRKAPICVAYVLCSIFFIASAFVPKSIWWAPMLFYVAGKMGSSYGIFSVQVVAMEIFPTTSRNSLLNVANTVGRLGGVLAPQVPLLERYMHGMATVTFGIVALGPAMLALLLPDTSKSVLPENVTQAENLDKLSEAEESQNQEKIGHV